MNSIQIDSVLKFISVKYSIDFMDILHTLATYSLLPPYLKIKYSKLSIYKNPAVKLIAEKYTICSSGFTTKNKMKIINLKEQIKLYSKQLEVKYLYMIFIKKFGIVTGLDLLHIVFKQSR